MTPTGAITDDAALVLRRRFRSPIDDVWASVTESDRLARWFGTWTGDPASGSVMVTMNAEPGDVPAVEYTIDACDPPRLLSVSSVDDYGTWLITVELVEADGGTELTFVQRDLDLDQVHLVGPGWEWYLDRLVAAVAGRRPPTSADFESTYLEMGDAYRSAAAAAGARPQSQRE